MNDRIAFYLKFLLVLILWIFCVLYSKMSSNFAEVNVQFPFLDFPVFIGEFVLMICAFCFGVIFLRVQYPIKKWFWIFLFYAIWILIKALSGYFVYGPLAFRHAAMFYYAFFSLFAYMAALKIKSPVWLWGFAFGGFILLAKFAGIVHYFYFIYFASCCLCVSHFQSWKWKFFGVLVVLWAFPLSEFFNGGGSFILGNIGAAAAFSFAAVLAAKNIRKRVRALFVTGLGASVVIGLIFFAPRSEVKTLINPETIYQRFLEVDKFIQATNQTFVPVEIDPKIYHVNTTKPKRPPAANVTERALIGKNADNVTQQQQEESSTRIAYNNVLFRLFIWRDMMNDFFPRYIVFGEPFGRPLRSTSIEIINQAFNEWRRDGWIEPHNSLLNIMYRGGILGAAVVGLMFFWLVKFFIFFINIRSYRGILMVSVLVQWTVLACFILVYELPYYAIPVWIWWGLTYCYYKKNINPEWGATDHRN